MILLRFIYYTCAFLILHSIIPSYAISDQPILRLETGMHTAPIRRIAVDPNNRYLVSASEDKTVRLWSLADRKLLQVLRPPIGKNNQGIIYAVAISPNGDTIAASGWTSEDGFDNVIYLFDRLTGQMKQRIMHLPNVVYHLDYSPDGRYLVATQYGAGNGILIYRTSDYQLQHHYTDYENSTHWAEFGPDGQLVVSSQDGWIRLYDAEFNLIAKAPAPSGSYPFAARFSPQGDKIALGYFYQPYVDIIAGKDLQLLYSANTEFVSDNEDLNALAWSPDGRWLYAGGRFWDSGVQSRPVVRWDEAGQGEYEFWPVAANTVLDIRTLKTGDLVVSTFDPVLAFLNPQGKTEQLLKPGIADFRDNNTGFLLSEEGKKVQFGYQVFGQQPALFSLIERTLTLPPPTHSPYLSSPKQTADHFFITDWQSNTTPRFEAETLPMELDEICRSLAISHDEKHFLLGTSWYIRFFNQQGCQLWKRPTGSGEAWGVNIAANHKLATVALGNGVIRWYRLRDGELLLSFFPHQDGQRWIAWLPQGYYMAAPGGEELIGWHLNRGENQTADFFPATRFREQFYRPDIVQRVLTTLDTHQAIKEADQALAKETSLKNLMHWLPPIIDLFVPKQQSKSLPNSTQIPFAEETVDFTYRIRQPSGEPITALKVLVDGRPFLIKRQKENGCEAECQLPTDKKTDEISLNLPPNDVKVSLIAQNRFSASEPVTLALKWVGEKRPSEKPTLYVLAVGISDYADKNLQLHYAAKDAEDFAKILQTQRKSNLYAEVKVRLLPNASREEILTALGWLQTHVTLNDVAMLFFSGHGVNDSEGEYYFLPQDIDKHKINETGLVYHDIKNIITQLPSKTLLFIDSCHAGNVMGRGMVDIDRLSNDLSSSENGIVVFAATTGQQLAWENPTWGNGGFTKILVEGLSGEADYTQDQQISFTELNLHLANGVKQLTQGQQTPTTAIPKTIADFTVVTVPKN